jgi:hypothetical protein
MGQERSTGRVDQAVDGDAEEGTAGASTLSASMRICLLEATPIRMATKGVIAEPYRILATVGVFHLAIRDIEGLPQIPSPTYFRIWQTPLMADGVVGHAPRESIQPASPSPHHDPPPPSPWQRLPPVLAAETATKINCNSGDWA